MALPAIFLCMVVLEHYVNSHVLDRSFRLMGAFVIGGIGTWLSMKDAGWVSRRTDQDRHSK